MERRPSLLRVTPRTFDGEDRAGAGALRRTPQVVARWRVGEPRGCGIGEVAETEELGAHSRTRREGKATYLEEDGVKWRCRLIIEVDGMSRNHVHL